MNKNKKINVTKTFLPEQSEYQAILKRAWDTGWMTNRGMLVQELEAKLKSQLGVSNIIATTNGTLPIQIAIKALGLKGEVITTPFSYIATTSTIIWEGCSPVFVDINSETFNVDVTKIESKITSETSAILVTHVFGNPCDIEAIDVIAKKYKLQVIYDAAHCFGVEFNGKSIFEYGDISTCSFHATKIFHTGEGGALFTSDKVLHDKLFYHHNFGHNGAESYYGNGINAKMSELQAAMGLAIFPYIDNILEKRKLLYNLYTQLLGVDFQFQKIAEGTLYNYSYIPIIFRSEEELLVAIQVLNNDGVFPRRYFYPSLNTIDYINGGKMPVSEAISKRVLCLPLYHDLNKDDVRRICSLIIESFY